MTDDSNAKSFKHRCRHGSIYMADRADLRGGLLAYIPPDLTTAQIVADAMQAGAFHAANVWPALNGFAGYDALRIETYTNDGAPSPTSPEKPAP